MKYCKDCFYSNGKMCKFEYRNYNNEEMELISCEHSRCSELYCGVEAKCFCEKKKNNVMYPNVNEDNDLEIIIDDGDYNNVIGKITNDGKCSILNVEWKVRAFEKWLDGGGVYSDEIVEWRGGKYKLNNWRLERVDFHNGIIYNFESCTYSECCEDENIKRHRNGTPIGF